MNDEYDQYDSVGVTLSLDKKSRFNAHRVYIREGKVVLTEHLTLGRAASSALREAEHSLQRVIKEWMRGTLVLEQPETPMFGIAEET